MNMRTINRCLLAALVWGCLCFMPSTLSAAPSEADVRTPVRTAALLTGLVMAGEAVALYSGTQVFSRKKNPWINGKNNTLLGLDILCGAALVYLSSAPLDTQTDKLLFYGCTSLSLLSHTYRDWEYLSGKPQAFCFNSPLFFVNNLKLGGLIFISAVGAGAGLTWIF